MTIDFIGMYFSEVASLTSFRNPLRSRRIAEARTRLNLGLPEAVAIRESAVPPVTMPDNVATEPCLLTLEAQEVPGRLCVDWEASLCENDTPLRTLPAPKQSV